MVKTVKTLQAATYLQLWVRYHIVVTGVHTRRVASLVRNQKDARIADLERQVAAKDQQMISQLAAKDQQMAAQMAAKDEQIAAKDRQIDELIKAAKKPRTVNNTTKYVVHQHVNCFGNESVEHITGQEIQKLLADPANACRNTSS